jgi:hypothetical protein
MAKLQVIATYVSGDNSVTVSYDEKNYENVKEIEASLETSLGSDDYWIDDLWVEGSNLKVEWKDILADTRIKADMLSHVFENDEEFFVKVAFLTDRQYDIDENILEEVTVYNASKDRWIEGNYKSEYPDGLLEEWAETFYPDLLKELEKANSETYFDWARLFSDNEVNGDFDSMRVDTYFVYMYRQ